MKSVKKWEIEGKVFLMEMWFFEWNSGISVLTLIRAMVSDIRWMKRIERLLMIENCWWKMQFLHEFQNFCSQKNETNVVRIISVRLRKFTQLREKVTQFLWRSKVRGWSWNYIELHSQEYWLRKKLNLKREAGKRTMYFKSE